MKFIRIFALAVMALLTVGASAQLNKGKLISGAIKAGGKAAQALTLTDAQMGAYVKEYITWMRIIHKYIQHNLLFRL